MRTQPGNLQHPEPVFLLPYELLGVQLALPFVLGAIIATVVLRQVARREQGQPKRRQVGSAG